MKYLLNRRKYHLYLLAAVILAAVIIPSAFLIADRYSAYASGLQATGVLIALILAMVTLDADRHDKKVGYHPGQFGYLESWRNNRNRDFGHRQ
jgi:hypothetical protein